jgi:hypothetical protein
MRFKLKFRSAVWPPHRTHWTSHALFAVPTLIGIFHLMPSAERRMLNSCVSRPQGNIRIVVSWVPAIWFSHPVHNSAGSYITPQGALEYGDEMVLFCGRNSLQPLAETAATLLDGCFFVRKITTM